MKLSVFSLLVLVLPSIGHAVPISQLFKGLPHQAQTSETCTNFQGIWEGTCTLTGSPDYTQQLVISQQDCDGIELGNTTMLIPFHGSMNVTSNYAAGKTIPESTWVESISAKWNVDNTSFEVSDETVVKDTTDKLSETIKSAATYQMVNGDLQVLQTATIENATSTGICDYKKKQ
jgi:hypothetical protein